MKIVPVIKQTKGLSLCCSPHHEFPSRSSMLLLLLSRFSHVRLCATPETEAHQAPPSLGFSRQEHWSGLPSPSPMHESEKWKGSRSVVSDSWQPMDYSLPGSSIHGIFQARVLEWGAIAFSSIPQLKCPRPSILTQSQLMTCHSGLFSSQHYLPVYAYLSLCILFFSIIVKSLVEQVQHSIKTSVSWHIAGIQ